MANLILTPENQIQRLNTIFNTIDGLQKLSFEVLITPPSEKSWSIVEVLEHLNIAYSFYEEKINTTLEKSMDSTSDSWRFKCRPWQRFIIEMQRPKGNTRKWKMKTLKRFEPVFAQSDISKEKVDVVFKRFQNSYGHMKQSILESRSKDMKKHSLSSALGSVVRFKLPEAFEFLLCHLERHMVQIEKIYSQNS